MDFPAFVLCLRSRLLEVTLQQALQSDAVASPVTSHLMDGLQNAVFRVVYLLR